MSKAKFMLPAVIAAAGLLVSLTNLSAKTEYTKQTKKACGFCHVDSKAKPKELKDAGKYFKEHKSLDGYTEAK
jgi:hypothetical protein